MEVRSKIYSLKLQCVRTLRYLHCCWSLVLAVQISVGSTLTFCNFGGYFDSLWNNSGDKITPFLVGIYFVFVLVLIQQYIWSQNSLSLANIASSIPENLLVCQAKSESEKALGLSRSLTFSCGCSVQFDQGTLYCSFNDLCPTAFLHLIKASKTLFGAEELEQFEEIYFEGTVSSGYYNYRIFQHSKVINIFNQSCKLNVAYQK